MTARSTLLAVAAIAATGVAGTGCPPAPAPSPAIPPHAPPSRQLDALRLAGDWRWILRTEEAGTSRVETENWRIQPDPAQPLRLVGRYVRTVDVRSLDRVPFRCNERPWYRQRAVYDVSIDLDPTQPDHYAIAETAYQTEPSPCDHGFRHLGAYAAIADGGRLVLSWDGGAQTLWKIADQRIPSEPVPAPWPASYDPAGTWRWDATSYDGQGNARDESEWWELTAASPTHIDGTYRRRVTTRSPGGAPIACAGAPAWSFDDAYVLQGDREETHWRFREIAVEPGDHPCLRATPRRTLDEATGEQIGDFLVLEWRGKRHQVLYRPDPPLE